MSIEKKSVYSLIHVYERDDEDEIKELGIYSTYQKAQEAMYRYFKLQGFNNYPIDCFQIKESIVDEDAAWTEGFCSSNEIAREFEYLTECFNEWLGIQKTAEESWEDDNYYQALCEISPKVYNAKDVSELASHISLVWSVRFKESPKSPEDCIDIATKVLKT